MAHLQAKSGGNSPLLGHLKDVCGQAREFLTAYKPKWPMADGADLRRIMAYAALLHDFGKIHPGFQSALRKGPRFNNRHEVLSLAFLDWLAMPANEAGWVAAAIATHHRGWYKIKRCYVGRGESETDYFGLLCAGVPVGDAALLHEVLTVSSEIFAESGWEGFEAYRVTAYGPLNYRKAIGDRLDAIETHLKCVQPPGQTRPGPKPVRDWRFVIAGIHARGWLLSADHLASFRKTVISAKFESTAECFGLYPGLNWKGHQLNAAAHCGSGLLVAPTGSGKTEAALLWAARQAEDGAHGRLCILLPYQASLNAMQRRLMKVISPEMIDKPERWGESVGLMHGRASRYLYEAFLRREENPAKAQSGALAQNSLARLFSAPVALSTVFSVIRLLFSTRGAERLFATYSGARIVVDEVHAYEPQITAMGLAVLRFLEEHLNARVLFMSATVPRHLERALGVRRVVENPPWNPKPRHQITVLPFDCLSEQAIAAIAAAAGSKSVLVVVNQVKRAIQLRKQLAAKGADTALLHSRYTFADRDEIERSSLTPVMGRVLVATQAVEVSLDLDFGVCFTELAPIESIAQRLGRCNRYGNGATPADVHVFGEFPAGRQSHLPYVEEHIKEVSRVLCDFTGGNVRTITDRQMDELLNNSYPEVLKRELETAIVEKTTQVRTAFLDDWKPFGLDDGTVCKALEAEWEKLFDGEEVLPDCFLAKAKAAESWLALGRLFVPIGANQMQRAKRDGHIGSDEELGCCVIRRPYGEDGLEA